MTKKVYRVRNWRDYNQALVNRGSISFWFSEEIIKDWHTNDSKKTRGRPRKYSDIAITCGLTLKSVFHLTFRAAEGFIRSLMHQLKIKAQSPDYSLLCKRQKNLKVNFANKPVNPNESIHILVDTTGLKVFGEGEWKVRKHGEAKRRLWRKLHLAINRNSQEIEAFELTKATFQDGDGLPLLTKEINKKVDKVIGDGAYDQYAIYKLSREEGFTIITPPRKDAKLTKECTSDCTRQKQTPEILQALKKRDEHIENIRKIGRQEWKNEMGYHQRSLAETAMFRLKTVLGNRLSARKLENQKVEAAIWCRIINQVTALGLPISVSAD